MGGLEPLLGYATARAKQTDATQAYHRGGVGLDPPAAE